MVAELYPASTTDPILFHALLSTAAAHQTCLIGSKEPSLEVIRHRGQAIRLLNQKLESPDLIVDDALIATVLLLAVHDVS